MQELRGEGGKKKKKEEQVGYISNNQHSATNTIVVFIVIETQRPGILGKLWMLYLPQQLLQGVGADCSH